MSRRPISNFWFWVFFYSFMAGFFLLLFIFFTTDPASPHDIYSGVHGKDGQLCCGDNDCSATTYVEHGEQFSFLTREYKWVQIPVGRITFLPIPGDRSTEPNHGHICYRAATDIDRKIQPQNVFGEILLYCVFVPPGGV